MLAPDVTKVPIILALPDNQASQELTLPFVGARIILLYFLATYSIATVFIGVLATLELLVVAIYY
jgi:hypothetical protein